MSVGSIGIDGFESYQIRKVGVNSCSLEACFRARAFLESTGHVHSGLLGE